MQRKCAPCPILVWRRRFVNPASRAFAGSARISRPDRHDHLGNTGRKTGFWLEELAASYYLFEDAGGPLSPKSPINGTR